jgi:hypothetical protein
MLRNRTRNHFMTLDPAPYGTDQISGENTTKCRFFSMILQYLATNQSWIQIRKFLVKDFKVSVADPISGAF